MPIYDLQCSTCNKVDQDRYFKTRTTNYGRCACGGRMEPQLALAVPLLQTFASDRERIDLHIRPDGKPQVITSWGQRKRLMKEFNLEDGGSARRRI